MGAAARDLVTVDMRGLKAALVAHPKSRRTGVSAVVRAAVRKELGLSDSCNGEEVPISSDPMAPTRWVLLHARFTESEAQRIAAGAKAAGLSRAAYLAGLLDDVPVLRHQESRPALLAALTASSAELSTLSRNVHQLMHLLAIGDVPQALKLRKSLDGLTGEVRGHLLLAAAALSELQPRRRCVPAPNRTSLRRAKP